jgi:NADH-quinone oxidoreductase subunit N
MITADFLAIAPIITLAVGATLLMLQIALKRSAALARSTTIGVLVAGFASCFFALDTGPRLVTPPLQADALAMTFTALFCAGTAACVYLSRDYLPGLSDQGDEYYLLLLLASLGAVVLMFSTHVASLLLGLEPGRPPQVSLKLRGRQGLQHFPLNGPTMGKFPSLISRRPCLRWRPKRAICTN